MDVLFLNEAFLVFTSSLVPVAARALQTVALCHGVAVLRDGLCAFGVFLGACLRACVVEVVGLFPARNYGVFLLRLSGSRV